MKHRIAAQRRANFCKPLGRADVTFPTLASACASSTPQLCTAACCQLLSAQGCNSAQVGFVEPICSTMWKCPSGTPVKVVSQVFPGPESTWPKVLGCQNEPKRVGCLSSPTSIHDQAVQVHSLSRMPFPAGPIDRKGPLPRKHWIWMSETEEAEAWQSIQPQVYVDNILTKLCPHLPEPFLRSLLPDPGADLSEADWKHECFRARSRLRLLCWLHNPSLKQITGHSRTWRQEKRTTYLASLVQTCSHLPEAFVRSCLPDPMADLGKRCWETACFYAKQRLRLLCWLHFPALGQIADGDVNEQRSEPMDSSKLNLLRRISFTIRSEGCFAM